MKLKLIVRKEKQTWPIHILKLFFYYLKDEKKCVTSIMAKSGITLITQALRKLNTIHRRKKEASFVVLANRLWKHVCKVLIFKH